MSHASKNLNTLEILKLRADFIARIRAFFSSRQVLEVETPILCQHTVTDPHIESFATRYSSGNTAQDYYLQTSPEYSMKRLLANGSGAIYQISKSFRTEELGRLHNPEFTMLEWYRPGFNHHDLMSEIDALLQHLLHSKPAQKISYRELFQQFLNIDPFEDPIETLRMLVKEKIQSSFNSEEEDFDTCLHLLLTHCIEPQLGFSAPLFIYDFPPSQAALSYIREDSPRVAERFELYIQGIEIANGFHELSDAKEQRLRFEKDQNKRRQSNRFVPSLDERLLSALEQGLPDCSGVALGVDRLLMIKAGTSTIRDIMSFYWDNA